MTVDLLFEIAHQPIDDRDRLETLEPVLAAATLELDIDVLFRGAGAGHLAGPGSERWNQVIDFGLGRLWLCSKDGGAYGSGCDVESGVEPDVGCRGVEAERIPVDAIEQFRRRARKIVEL
ncbi:hypothetical protein [Halomonas denitrificans]|nr:hypothetical protein [Halomonas denitrificans]